MITLREEVIQVIDRLEAGTMFRSKDVADLCHSRRATTSSVSHIIHSVPGVAIAVSSHEANLWMKVSE